MESIDIKNIELQAASATLLEAETATVADKENQTENDRINFCKELVLKSGVRPVEVKFERVYDCFSSAVLGFIGKVYVAGGTLGGSLAVTGAELDGFIGCYDVDSRVVSHRKAARRHRLCDAGRKKGLPEAGRAEQ